MKLIIQDIREGSPAGKLGAEVPQHSFTGPQTKLSPKNQIFSEEVMMV